MTSSLTAARRIAEIYGKTAALILAILAGLSFPQAHGLVFLVPYLVATMLFLSFLDLHIGAHSFERGILPQTLRSPSWDTSCSFR
jgi:hypothetical protein